MDIDALSGFFDEISKLAISGNAPKAPPPPKLKATNPTPRVPAAKLAPTPAVKAPAAGGTAVKLQAQNKVKPMTQYMGRGGAKTMAGGYGRMQAAARSLKNKPSIRTNRQAAKQQPRAAATIPTKVVRRAPTGRPARPFVPPSAGLGLVGQPMNRRQALGF
jgi:hypothetical protein